MLYAVAHSLKIQKWAIIYPNKLYILQMLLLLLLLV